jgi:hypothetical protein
VAGRPKSPEVVGELHQLMGLTDDPARRDVLRLLLAGEGPGASR